MDYPTASRVAAVASAMGPFLGWAQESGFFDKAGDPAFDNFAVGNPQDMPLPAFVAELQRAAVPRDKDWFAYKLSEPGTQAVVADALRAELGIPFEPADIALTNGAFGALATALAITLDPGDEVIINLPPWFFYEAMIVNCGGVPVKVSVDARTFDLDLAAIEAAITSRTRAIIVNTPNNPTGRIYPPRTLERLAELLDAASRRNGRPVWLISDEPYRRIRFDDAPFHSPLAYYTHAMMTYSYGKVLLTPGQRLGYLALPPNLPDRDVVRQAIQTVQVASGWMFPNAIMQHGIAAFEQMSIDMAAMQAKRDRMTGTLREIGYAVHAPEGTFYLLPKSPWADDVAFVRELDRRNILCLPGAVLELPGFFRISLTANEDMIERSLAGFASAFDHAQMHADPGAAVARA